MPLISQTNGMARIFASTGPDQRNEGDPRDKRSECLTKKSHQNHDSPDDVLVESKLQPADNEQKDDHPSREGELIVPDEILQTLQHALAHAYRQ